MPLYQISTASSISVEKREELANLIMNIHCGITGAPETFVNVFFWENVPLKDGIVLNVLAGVRKGRGPKMNALLKSEMLKGVSELMNVPEFQTELVMSEMPAQWIMEGGEILPEPGEEAMCEWLQKQQEEEAAAEAAKKKARAARTAKSA